MIDVFSGAGMTNVSSSKSGRVVKINKGGGRVVKKQKINPKAAVEETQSTKKGIRTFNIFMWVLHGFLLSFYWPYG